MRDCGESFKGKKSVKTNCEWRGEKEKKGNIWLFLEGRRREKSFFCEIPRKQTLFYTPLISPECHCIHVIDEWERSQEKSSKLSHHRIPNHSPSSKQFFGNVVVTQFARSMKRGVFLFQLSLKHNACFKLSQIPARERKIVTNRILLVDERNDYMARRKGWRQIRRWRPLRSWISNFRWPSLHPLHMYFNL